jgi:hypothetical protein
VYGPLILRGYPERYGLFFRAMTDREHLPIRDRDAAAGVSDAARGAQSYLCGQPKGAGGMDYIHMRI